MTSRLNGIRVCAKIEVLGLFLALISGIWQISIMKWWDEQVTEAQYFIDVDVYRDILQAHEKLAGMIANHDMDSAYKQHDDFRMFIFKSLNRLNNSLSQRQKIIHSGQYALFRDIGVWLVIIGGVIAFVARLLELISQKK